MKKIILAILAIFASISAFEALSIEIVYSADGLEKCSNVGEYSRTVRLKASRKNVERKLTALGNKDHATHIFVTEYIDNSEKGKGITVKAIGKKCE